MSSCLQIFVADLPHQPFFLRFLLPSCRAQQTKGVRIVIATKKQIMYHSFVCLSVPFLKVACKVNHRQAQASRTGSTDATDPMLKYVTSCGYIWISGYLDHSECLPQGFHISSKFSGTFSDVHSLGSNSGECSPI